MKKVVLILIATILGANIILAQSNTNERYVLYPTKNIWTFLKLDTSDGRIWQVQYSVSGADYRFETVLNNTPYVLDEDKPCGRFKLYPTDNTYNFVLLDTKFGTAYQVQWSQESKNRTVFPISRNAPLVWSCGYAKIETLGLWNFIDEYGHFLSSESFASCEDFEKGYAYVKKNGKSNYIDTKGQYLFNEWYEACTKYNKYNLAFVRDNGRENVLDVNQKPILVQWYDKCWMMTDGYVGVMNNHKYNLCDMTGKLVFSEWYDDIGAVDDNGYMAVSNGDKWNFVDLKGQIVFAEWYDYCHSFENGYSKVENDQTVNYVGIDGSVLLKDWYSYCGDIENGMVSVTDGEKWNFVDVITGLTISEEWFDDCYDFGADGMAKVLKGDQWYMIDRKGQLGTLPE